MFYIIFCRQAQPTLSTAIPHLTVFRWKSTLCRRWCEIPGVGPMTAMTFLATVDDPRRFAKSKTLGAHFGLQGGLQKGDSDAEGEKQARRRVACHRQGSA